MTMYKWKPVLLIQSMMINATVVITLVSWLEALTLVGRMGARMKARWDTVMLGKPGKIRSVCVGHMGC